jgi:hypothetical protein
VIVHREITIACELDAIDEIKSDLEFYDERIEVSVDHEFKKEQKAWISVNDSLSSEPYREHFVKNMDDFKMFSNDLTRITKTVDPLATITIKEVSEI